MTRGLSRIVLTLFIAFTAITNLSFGLRAACAAQSNFYTLADQFDRSALSGKSKQAMRDETFGKALSYQQGTGSEIPPPPTLRMNLTQIVSQSSTIEIQEQQPLFVTSQKNIVKFIATDEGIVSIDTASPDTVRILGSGVGKTFVHIWDAGGRNTFEVQVTRRPFTPSRYQVEQAEVIEKSRPFKFGYDNNMTSSYSGPRFRDKERSSVDFDQNFNLNGDTPYGYLRTHALTQRANQKTQLTDAQVVLEDGKLGPFRHFDLSLGDSSINPGLMAFSGGRIRGTDIVHRDPKTPIRMEGFYGREQSSIIGTLTPGVVSKRTIDSYLSGGILNYKVNEQADVKLGQFFGFGKSRQADARQEGTGLGSQIKLGPHTTLDQEIDFDGFHFAHKEALTSQFEKLKVRNEWRDVSKKFQTMLGSPSRQGEIGNLLDISAQPTSTLSVSGTLDIFHDRLIFNPESPGSRNVHADLLVSYFPSDDKTFTFNFQDQDDTGRIGPTRQRTIGGQYNQRFQFLGHRATFFSRYQNRGNRILTNSLSNYVDNQVLVGFNTELFWGINFTMQKEWHGLKEPNINRFTRPQALTYDWDFSHQLGASPFYMDARLRIRDEEDTESPNSFMTGEDSTEISGGLHYKEFEDLELYLTGSFTQYNPESGNVEGHRIEAQVITGMRYLYDTGWRWGSVGSFDGFVYKDLNGNGVREPGDPGLAGMIVQCGDGRSATTDARGYYSFKNVSGKISSVTLDSSKLPYGYAPTGSLRQEREIIQDKIQSIDFGITPRSEITGILFNDLNGNGKYDLGDPGVRKVKLTLESGQSVRTNHEGSFTFSDVIAGPHTVAIALQTLPDGYLPEDVPKKNITLFEGMRYEMNFPMRAVRSVTGRVFVDENQNQVFDSNEKTLSGVKVLMGTKSVVTDAEGWYLFDELNAGTYQITMDPTTLPWEYVPSEPREVTLSAEPRTITDLNLAVKKK